jgi:hypothetical protein
MLEMAEGTLITAPEVAVVVVRRPELRSSDDGATVCRDDAGEQAASPAVNNATAVVAGH